MADYNADSKREHMNNGISAERERLNKKIEQERTGQHEQEEPETVTITAYDELEQKSEKEPEKKTCNFYMTNCKSEEIKEMERMVKDAMGNSAVIEKDFKLPLYIHINMIQMKSNLCKEDYADELVHMYELVTLDKESRDKLVDYEEFRKMREHNNRKTV